MRDHYMPHAGFRAHSLHSHLRLGPQPQLLTGAARRPVAGGRCGGDAPGWRAALLRRSPALLVCAGREVPRGGLSWTGCGCFHRAGVGLFAVQCLVFPVWYSLFGLWHLSLGSFAIYRLAFMAQLFSHLVAAVCFLVCFSLHFIAEVLPFTACAISNSCMHNPHPSLPHLACLIPPPRLPA